jgi:hypothetical protein
MSLEDARGTVHLEKERPAAKEIGRPVAIGMGMTPELRQHRQRVTHLEADEPQARAVRRQTWSRAGAPVALRMIDPATIQVADGSLRAALECPTLPVSLASGERRWLAAMSTLLDRLDQPFQLVVQRRGQHLASASAAGGATSRLRDSYERLLAERWPDRPVPRSRFFAVVSSAANDDESAQASALERQVRAAGETLREAGIETVRVPADALAAHVVALELEEQRTEVRLAGHLARPLRVTECPTLMSSDWLAVLRATDADLDVSLHLRPPALASTGGRTVGADLLLTVWAADRARLDEATRALERALAERLVRTRRCAFEAEPAFNRTLPLGLARAAGWLSFPLRTLTSLLSCVWGGDADRDRGLLCGVEPGSGRPLLLDRHALTDRSSVVLGTAGAGQPSVLKVEVARARVAGAAATVVDTRGDLVPFVEALGGEVVRVGPDAGAPFDPFAVVAGRPGALSARITCLTAAIELLAGGLTDHQVWALEHALSYAYAARGHSDDGDRAIRTSPLAGDVVEALKRQSACAFGEVKAQMDALAHVLSVHVTGAGCWLLAGRPEPRPSPPLLACDLSGVPAEDRPAAALLAFDHACSSAWNGGGRLVLLDEMAGLIRHPRASAFLAEVTETAGAHGVGLRLATTDVAGLVRGPARRLVTGGHLKAVLKQAPDDLPVLAELLHLTPAEQSWLLAAGHAEGLLVTPEQRLAFELVMTDEERRLITQGAKR